MIELPSAPAPPAEGRAHGRRARFAHALGDGLALIPAAPEQLRNGDVGHAYRQASDFYFLTGCSEPEAVALFDPSHGSERFVLFVRPRDPELELWEGPRVGVDGAVAAFGADAAYPLSELATRLREHAGRGAPLFYRLGQPEWDGVVLDLLRSLRGHVQRQGGHPAALRLEDPGQLLDEQRLRKDAAEIASLRRAAAITCDGHAEAMRLARPGLGEHQLQAALELVFRAQGSPRLAYPSIVASGPNACVLHYTANDRTLQAGDLLLIDAGAELDQLATDVTRTFPVSGRFNPQQRSLYDIVLAAERAAIARAAPGVPFEELHAIARRVLTEGLVALGLLPCGVDESLALYHDREYFPHGTSHWLGLDVHDAGRYRVDGVSRPLEPGMVLTVEPGLYIPPGRDSIAFPLQASDEEARRTRRYVLGRTAAVELERSERAAASCVEQRIPADFQGIGIRIEDDILITTSGCEVLTRAVPTAADDIEALCRELPRWVRPEAFAAS